MAPIKATFGSSFFQKMLKENWQEPEGFERVSTGLNYALPFCQKYESSFELFKTKVRDSESEPNEALTLNDTFFVTSLHAVDPVFTFHRRTRFNFGF